MLLRYIFIRRSKRSKADTEIPDSDIFESDIRPSLEWHGIFEYILGIFENIWYLVTQAMGHKASQWHTHTHSFCQAKHDRGAFLQMRFAIMQVDNKLYLYNDTVKAEVKEAWFFYFFLLKFNSWKQIKLNYRKKVFFSSSIYLP